MNFKSFLISFTGMCILITGCDHTSSNQEYFTLSDLTGGDTPPTFMVYQHTDLNGVLQQWKFFNDSTYVLYRYPENCVFDRDNGRWIITNDTLHLFDIWTQSQGEHCDQHLEQPQKMPDTDVIIQHLSNNSFTIVVDDIPVVWEKL